MAAYKLDRTVFKAQTVEEAADHATYYRKLSWMERLRVAAYLNSVAFNYPLDDLPRMDKTKFKTNFLVACHVIKTITRKRLMRSA